LKTLADFEPGSGRTLRSVSGRIWAQNMELTSKRLYFFHFKWLAICCLLKRTSRSKIEDGTP